jgi:hypothetical protein
MGSLTTDKNGSIVVSPALAPAQRALGREVSPTVFAVDEFRSKLASGNDFLRSLMKEKKLFVSGTENEIAKLASKRLLVQHTSSADEIKNLLAISDRDLAACQKQLPADWRCAIAYNAALQAATAARPAAGYRATRDHHHYRVI